VSRAGGDCEREVSCFKKIKFVFRVTLVIIVTFILPTRPLGWAQDLSQAGQIDGVVRDSAGKPVADVVVLLQGESPSDRAETKTSADGKFLFSPVRGGSYAVTLSKSGFLTLADGSLQVAAKEKKHCEFVLQSSGTLAGAGTGTGEVQLDDRPNFTVAGITDTTGSGGHGSETRMRTGDILARETVRLEPVTPEAAATTDETGILVSALRAAVVKSPQSFEANHKLGSFYLRGGKCGDAIPPLKTGYQLNPADYANAFDLAQAYKSCSQFAAAREQVSQMLASAKEISKPDEAGLRQLLGDLDEKMDDPLGALKEYEQAAGLDPSEQNYFSWGAELLLHHAAAPAAEVFGRGARLHPGSARLLAGLGAALYSSGSSEDGARRLCDAADLEPKNPASYLFLGKMQEATAGALPCAEQRLARFVHDQPANALANYYDALAIWKQDRGLENPETFPQAESRFQKAIGVDPKFAVAYLQLGNLYLARGSLQEAVAAYRKAIAIDPGSSDAHYRLGLAYKRSGEQTEAQREFDRYKDLEKSEAEAIERQRRELQQFLFVLRDRTQVVHP
jgi:tetratricopeptide (TPR) repeat protein